MKFFRKPYLNKNMSFAFYNEINNLKSYHDFEIWTVKNYQSFAFSRRSLLGVLRLFLKYCDAPSLRKYILLCGTDSRAFAFEQAASIASTTIFNIWLYSHLYRAWSKAYIYSLTLTCQSLDLSTEHTFGVFYQSPFPQVVTRGQLRDLIGIWQFPSEAESTLLYKPSWKTSPRTLWNTLEGYCSRILVCGGFPEELMWHWSIRVC